MKLLLFIAMMMTTLIKGAQEWSALGPAVSGCCTAVRFNPENPKNIIFGTDMGALFISQNGGQSWCIAGSENQGGNPGYRGAWRVRFDPKNPQIIWVGSEHGVWRSADAGKTWKRSTSSVGGTNISIYALAIDSQNSDVVYAAQGFSFGKKWLAGRVWRTDDSGKTWQELASPAGNMPGTLFSDMIAEGNRVFICGPAGLYYSENSGQSWISLNARLPLPAEHPVKCMTLHQVPGGPLMLSVRSFRSAEKIYGGIYESNDSGKTWIASSFNTVAGEALEKMAAFDSPAAYPYVAGSKRYPNRIYAALHGGGVFRSDDSGKTWRNTHRTGTKWVKVKTSDGSSTNFLSNHKNTNFSNSVNYGTDGITSFAICDANPDFVAYTDYGSAVMSTDGGSTWYDVPFEYTAPFDQGRFDAELPSTLSWRVRSRGPQVIVCNKMAPDPHQPQIVYAAYQDHGLRVSRDGGESWERPSQGLEIYTDVCGARSFTTDPKTPGRIYFTSYYPMGRAFVSNDYGKTFRNISLPPLPGEINKGYKLSHTGIVIDPADNMHLYFTTDRGLFESINGGQSWQDITPTQLSGNPAVKIMQTTATGLFVGSDPYQTTKGGLYHSLDKGKTWKQIAPDLVGGVFDLEFAPANPQIAYMIANYPDVQGGWSEHPVLKSIDGGMTWNKITGDALYAGLAIHPQNPDILWIGKKAYDLNSSSPEYLRSDDGGKNWQCISDSIPICGTLSSITVNPQNPGELFFADWFSVWRLR